MASIPHPKAPGMVYTHRKRNPPIPRMNHPRIPRPRKMALECETKKRMPKKTKTMSKNKYPNASMFLLLSATASQLPRLGHGGCTPSQLQRESIYIIPHTPPKCKFAKKSILWYNKSWRFISKNMR